MKVSAILAQKAVEGVMTISPKAQVTDALSALADKGIGTLLVSEDGARALGILSERDIVRALAKSGSSTLTQRIESLMTPDPITCQPDDESDGVLAKMTAGRFRHMPVVDGDGLLKGLVSIGDVVKAQMTNLAYEKEALVDMIAGR